MARRAKALVAIVGALATLAVGCRRHVAPGPPLFEEVPESSGFSFRHELPGGTLDNLMKSAMGGVALVDYDDDGRVDVFCVNGGWDDRLAGTGRKPATLPTCRLYRNLGGMRFEDVTEKAGVGFTGFALGACVGDYDGDGRVDVFVSTYGRPALFRNKGDGTFEDAAAKAGVPPGFYAGATFLDYDRDGVVDLFVSQYVDPSDLAGDPRPQREGDFATPGAYQPQPARLFHGKGDGTFEDVTARAHVGTPGKGMGVLATDVDGDGWIDVFVANDGMPNFLWRNQGDGTFAEAAGAFNLAYGEGGDVRASMGVTAADLDGDGRLEYLVPDTTKGAAYVRRGRDREFVERANDWGLGAATFGFTGWSDVALDAENDGRLDVWKVHGDVRKVTDGQWAKLARNKGAGPKGGVAFVYEPPPPQREFEGAEAKLAGRGGVAADLDDDGREDLLLVGLNARARIFRNVTSPVGHWVRVKLVGKAGNTSALGARLTGKIGDRPVVREVSSATSYLCAPDLRQHVGLGDADELDDVVVRWPSGREQKVGSLEAGRTHDVREE
jgi:enediyne biosynthesis protein E4